MNIASQADYAKLWDLTGKVALVTGGGGVLGSAIAKGLGLAGAKVALASRTQSKLDAVATELQKLGIETMTVAMDATDMDAIRACADAIETKWGVVDILVNAAGGNHPDATAFGDKKFYDLPSSALEHVVGVNLFAGAIKPCQVFAKRMADSGKPASIINISSMAAFKPLTRVIGYAAAKAAVSNFTYWLSVYLTKEEDHPIRVNAIAPGFFLTEQNRFLLTNKEDGSLTARGNMIVDHTPMGRFGEPDELIGAAVWLASEASSFVNGIILPVDGGFDAFSGV